MRSNMMAWALAPRRFTGLFLILAMFGPTVVAAEHQFVNRAQAFILQVADIIAGNGRSAQ